MQKSSRGQWAAMLHVGVVALVVMAGCSGMPCRLGGWQRSGEDAGLAAEEPQIERGQPRPVLDAVGWVVGIPSKILLLDYRVSSHCVSAKTEVALQDYLNTNGLDKVKVRINQYDPCGEWSRLRQNRSVCWPVRYTVGTLSVVGYTLLPGRIFGGDGYNPYTNTVSLYSDVAPLGLYAAGHAKEFAHQEHKTLYALSTDLPLVNIGPETRAARDALDYLAFSGSSDELQQGYRSISPACALECGQPLQSWTGLPVVLPALVVGHAAGQIKAAGVHEDAPAPASHDGPPGTATTQPAGEEHPQPQSE